MKTLTQRILTVFALIPLLMLTACLGNNPPSEKDLVKPVSERLKAMSMVTGWTTTDIVISNLKCNAPSGDAYGCSFDVKGKQTRRNPFSGEVTERVMDEKAQSGRFVKNGDVWTWPMTF